MGTRRRLRAYSLSLVLLSGASTVGIGGTTPHSVYRHRDAFSQPVPNRQAEQRLDFAVGRGLFHRLWVNAPAST